MTTDIDLGAIEARANAATPEPWFVGIAPETGQWLVEHGDQLIASLPNGMADPQADAVFIANARTDVPKMAAEIRSLRDAYDCAHEDRLARTLERDRTIDEREYLKGEVARLRAENAAMLAAVRAADELVATAPATLRAFLGGAGEALIAAVAALPNSQEPCDTCSSTAGGCPECRYDGLAPEVS